MKRWLMTLGLGLAWASPSTAGELRHDLAVASDRLGRDLPYAIYLPDAYAAEPARRFPVIYLLHGHGGSATTWLEAGNAGTIADRLIEGGAIPPLILVMPDAGNSWYVDSRALGPEGMMASALVRDLIPHIDTTYRTLARREGRAIAGQSMGGFGALHLAFAHPDAFTAVASLSGAVFVGMPEAASIENLFGDVFGDPFQLGRYRRASPLGRIERQEVEVARLPEIYLTSGDDDYFRFYEGAALLFLELRDAGARAELRISDGGHDWSYWRAALAPALRFLTARLEVEGDSHAGG